MQAIAISFILIVGLMHLVPVVGVLSAERLQDLYGISVQDTDILILLRHRAIFFGLIGGLLIASAFAGSLRPVAMALGMISMLSFVLLAWLVGDSNAELRRVVQVDLAGSALLLCAIVLDTLAT